MPWQASSNCCPKADTTLPLRPRYEEAKRMLSEGSYDLLVTDVRLRSYNGLHLVKKVRRGVA